ncbi:MAG: hypothetical protein IJW45_08355 [Oscillospiraceae bacterium]|nr:hypothetical protein [Oscillospiraceae bacterium]
MTVNAKAMKAKAMMYKRPALASMGYDSIISELYEIEEACEDVKWFMEQGDDTLLNALGDDEEAEWEFRMAFIDLDGKAYQLIERLQEDLIREDYDDCTVALIGNRYETVGYDSYQEDYFRLTRYEAEAAQTEAGKRLMRHTKAEMISTFGQCLGTLIAFLDLRQQYDYLKAAMDVLRDENTSLLKLIKEIDEAYDAAEEVGFNSWYTEARRFDQLVKELPERMWLE